MNCDNCGRKLKRLKRRYFSKKLRCPNCNYVVDDTFPVDWEQIKDDLMIMFRIVRQG